MTVELALEGDRALAGNDERRQRALTLPGVGLAGDHAVLLLHGGVGGGRLHAAEFERLAAVFVEIGKDRRGRYRLSREGERRVGPGGAGGFGDCRPVLGDQLAGDTVIGAGAGEIVFDDRDAIGLPGLDRPVQQVDRCFFEAKPLVGHGAPPFGELRPIGGEGKDRACPRGRGASFRRQRRPPLPEPAATRGRPAVPPGRSRSRWCRRQGRSAAPTCRRAAPSSP